MELRLDGAIGARRALLLSPRYLVPPVRRSLVRWVLFLCGAVAWAVLVMGAARHYGVPLYRWEWLLWLPFLAILVPMALTLVATALSQRAMAVSGPERDALLDRALDWARVGSPALQSALLASRASEMLASGDPTRAMLIFVPQVESGWFRLFGRHRSVALLELSRICIALSDLEGAEAWLRRAEQAGPPRRRALGVGSEALVWLRQGHVENAQEHLEAWLAQPSGSQSEWSHNLCVFLLHYADDHLGHAGVLPFDIQPYAHLSLAWPALRDFVARQHALQVKGREPRSKEVFLN